jgi:ABC-type polysaccharide/polyol phosphate transport system ATPase subunit
MSVIVAAGVAKRFLLRHSTGSLKAQVLDTLRGRHGHVEEFWALRDVSFRIDPAESVGLVGRNGSGKSTLLKLIAGIHRPTRGHLFVSRDLRVGSMIELGIGFHPELSGAENVYINAAIHGLQRDQIDAIYPGIVEYSGLAQFMDVPLKSYSSGMHMRLAFATAAQMDPDLLLLDEIFAVGDEDFQRKCMRTITAFQERGRTILFVSHSADAIRAMCERVIVLDRGRLVFDGDTERGLDHYHGLLTTGEGPLARSIAGEGATDAPGQDWHRRAGGPRWAERGDWALDFLKRQGLTPQHFILDIACGDFSGPIHVLPYMDPRHYWGFDRHRELFDAGAIEVIREGIDPERGHFFYNDTFDFGLAPYPFDFILAASLFVRLPLNHVAHALAAGLAKLKPGGTLFATFYEADPPDVFASRARCDGFVTYGDHEPYHYSFSILAGICETLGGRAERLDERHPAGEAVMAIRRGESGGA